GPPGDREIEEGELLRELVPLAIRAESLRPFLEPAEITGDLEGRLHVALPDRLDDANVDARELRRAFSVIEEGFPGGRAPLAHDLLADEGRVGPDLLLGMGIHAQREEVEEVVEVDL